MRKDQTVAVISYGATGLIIIYVFFKVLPYIIVFLVIYGAWHLFQEDQGSDHHHHRNNRRRRCNRRWRW